MCTTSKKHEDFVKQPIDNKLVGKLPGIGAELGVRLAQAGYSMASQVLGQFLVWNKDRARFLEWMKTLGANNQQSIKCYEALKEYCNHHM